VGTSTVNRSPDTTRWRVVNRLYDDDHRNARRLLSEILNASDDYASGLADGASRARLAMLIENRQLVADPTPQLVAIVLDRASEQAGAANSSFYGDIAHRALHQTLREGTQGREGTHEERLLGAFVENLLATTVAHVVARDLWAHVGSRAIPNARSAVALRESLVQQVRLLTNDPNVTRAVRLAARDPGRNWSRLLQRIWAYGKDSALEQASEPR
jgi:hypothetical protein